MELDNSTINKLTSKLEELIKKRIKDLDLIKTGKLYNSIDVTYNNGEFIVNSTNYYKFLDEKHDITNYVLESTEWNTYMMSTVEDYMIIYYNNEINKSI